jgi:hypothetical protein
LKPCSDRSAALCTDADGDVRAPRGTGYPEGRPLRRGVR